MAKFGLPGGGRRTRQPQAPVRINPKWAGRIPFAWSASNPLTAVTGPEGTTLSGVVTGADPTGTIHTIKDRGRVVNFHPAGGADGVGGVNTKKSSGQDVTVFWFGYPQTSLVTYLQVLNRGQNSDSLRINPMVGISYIDSSPAQFDANYATAKTPIEGQYEAIAGRKSGSTLKSFDWRTHVTAETTGGNGTFRTDSAGDYFYVNHSDSAPRGHAHCLLTFAVNGFLSDTEIWNLLQNPWQIFEPRKQNIYVSAASGATARTSTVSLTAAIQQARTATASISSAVQVNRSTTSGLDSAILRAITVQTGLSAALKQLRTITPGADAVIQRALNASASLNTAIKSARTATAGMDGYVLGGNMAVSSLTAAIKASRTALSSVDAAIQSARTASTGLSAGVLERKTAIAALNAYIFAGQMAVASINAAILERKTYTTAMNAYVLAGVLLSAPRTLSSNTQSARRSNTQTARRP